MDGVTMPNLADLLDPLELMMLLVFSAGAALGAGVTAWLYAGRIARGRADGGRG
jgi:hypothetical protein